MLYKRYLNQAIVIIINNLLVYINMQILAAIKEEGYIIRYLPLYLLDFNLIKFI